MERTELQKAKSMKRREKRKQSRKRRREQMMQGTNKKHSSGNGGIDKLSDDVLIDILSRLSIKEAVRASVLARRWRHLWMFTYGTLRLDQRDTAKGILMKWKRFESRVNKVVELHQGRFIEGMIISVQANGERYHTSIRASRPVDSCVYFATLKEVQRLEVNLSFSDRYEFPSVERLILHSHGVTSPLCRLRFLRLAHVDIKDDVLHYLLTSCANLEELCIHFSHITKNLRVIDPPSLRNLEISECSRIESLEISAANLVSLTYEGRKISLLLKKTPVLRTLTIDGLSCLSFLLEPKEHLYYLAQLEKLVLDFRFKTMGMRYASLDLPQLYSLKRLDLRVITVPGRSLLSFISLIKAAPQLCEFRIELSYKKPSSVGWNAGISPLALREHVKFVHKELKSVEVARYIGCVTGNELVSALVKIGPSIERVVLDTSGDYFDPDTERDSYFAFGRRTEKPDTFLRPPGASTRKEAKERARNLVSKFFPQHIQATVT